MTNANKPHVHSQVIKAWADGAEIEYRHNSDHEWATVNDPQWYPYTEYRIKTHPVFKYHGIMEGFENSQPDGYNHTTGYHSCAAHVRSAQPEKWTVIAIVKTTFVDGVPVAVELVK